MPLRQHEQIAVFYKKPPTYNPQFTEGNHYIAEAHLTYQKNLLITIMATLMQPMIAELGVRRNIQQAYWLFKNHIQVQQSILHKSQLSYLNG